MAPFASSTQPPRRRPPGSGIYAVVRNDQVELRRTADDRVIARSRARPPRLHGARTGLSWTAATNRGSCALPMAAVHETGRRISDDSIRDTGGSLVPRHPRQRFTPGDLGARGPSARALPVRDRRSVDPVRRGCAARDRGRVDGVGYVVDLSALRRIGGAPGSSDPELLIHDGMQPAAAGAGGRGAARLPGRAVRLCRTMTQGDETELANVGRPGDSTSDAGDRVDAARCLGRASRCQPLPAPRPDVARGTTPLQDRHGAPTGGVGPRRRAGCVRDGRRGAEPTLPLWERSGVSRSRPSSRSTCCRRGPTEPGTMAGQSRSR